MRTPVGGARPLYGMLLLQIPIPSQSPPDGGAWYAETDLSHFIAEPWNALSSLAFLLPVIYWLYKLRGQYKQYQFLVSCMPLLALGGLGSTIYHAFRSSYIFLMMDVIPIAVLTLMVSIYFWWRILRRWEWVLVIVIVFLSLRIGVFSSGIQPMQRVINLSYFITGVMLFLPALLLMARTQYRGGKMIVLATVFFIISLVFRQIDSDQTLLPMGTHWLWHVCCAVGTFFLAEYLYLIAPSKRKKATV